jgi:hypothetical protein
MKDWNWAKFFVKVTSAAMWAWAAATVFVFIVCIRYGGHDHEWIKIAIIGWIIISGLFIGGKVLVDALAVAVSKADIKANIDVRGGIGK